MNKQSLIDLPELDALRTLSRDGRMLFIARLLRMFAFGFLSVILALYLAALNFTDQQIGFVFTAMLAGDAVLSLLIASVADRVGRRRMLLLGTLLMIAAGAMFAWTRNPLLLTLAAIIGTMSPNGAEVGPFLSIEQAALPQTTRDAHRTAIFGWYNLIALSAKALGSLGGGVLAGALLDAGTAPIASYRTVVIVYTVLGVLLLFFNLALSPGIEVRETPAPSAQRRFGLHRSRGVVMQLAALFALDAFGGGLIIQSLIAYWFTMRFDAGPAALGVIFFGVNLLGGISTLIAARVAARFGLINTMVWTHIPSNVLLMLVPLMPTLPLAVLVLLARSCISQMDVPTRQSYTMAVVAPDERSAAAGITTIARTVGSTAAPALTGLLFAASLFSAPFFLAGGLKIIYDLSLFFSFRALKPPEEQEVTEQQAATALPAK
jgi:MFS family permease